jgi:nucleoid DNA-binding protein/cell division septation protein DedD
LDILYHIKDLLLSRNGLVIPGIGSFTVHYLPAEVDKTRNKILPPRRSYSFNSELKVDHDKILLKRLTSAYNVTQKEASEKMSEFESGFKETLDTKKEYKIEGIGRFYKDDKGKLKFEDESEIEKKLGLDELEAQPFELEKTEKPDRTTTNKAPLRHTRTKKKRRKPGFYISIAAGVLLILFIAAGIYSGFFTYYYNKFSKELIAEKNNQPVPAEQKQTPKTKDTTKASPLDNKIDKMTDKKKALMFEETRETVHYHLVAGSFKKRDNAETFQEELSKDGFSSEILEKNGLYRVSIHSYTKKEEALVSLYHIRDTTPYKSVWLLTLREKAH